MNNSRCFRASDRYKKIFLSITLLGQIVPYYLALFLLAIAEGRKGLLIVLSVMDFIKAVASDSEDEIRKVGSKFVKRLIVAALIFILPLLLEFLLGIFNIPINDFCLK